MASVITSVFGNSVSNSFSLVYSSKRGALCHEHSTAGRWMSLKAIKLKTRREDKRSHTWHFEDTGSVRNVHSFTALYTVGRKQCHSPTKVQVL